MMTEPWTHIEWSGGERVNLVHIGLVVVTVVASVD